MNDRTFIIGLHGGWGIRFLMLGAARIFARRHQRRLRVYWGHDFPCPWPFDVKSVDLMPASEWRNLIAQRPALWGWDDFKTMWTDEKGASDVEILALSAAYPPYKALGLSPEDTVEEVRGWIDFSPIASLADRIADRIRPVTGYVGVHIRRTQPVTDCVPVPETPTSWYLDEMRKFSPGTQFFVCSDSKNEIETLRQSFPKIQTSGLTPGRTSTTLLNGLIEMVLLSRCREIIGSLSSFSRFAALYGNCRLFLDRNPASLPWWS